MGLFSRRSRGDAIDPDADVTAAPGAVAGLDAYDGPDDGRPLRPDSEPPGEVELSRIAAGLARLAEQGVDVDDLARLGAAYDAAVTAHAAGAGTTDRDHTVDTIGIGIGEHLVRHARMDWAVISDVFGTDLGVVARRRGTAIIPANIVATRWINGETGWLPGVVAHLVRLGTG
ncbi:MAG: DUF3806 domain-containing protein [Nostocoides sp.]